MALTLLLVAGGFGAGAFGALLGLGGGVLIVPLLALGLGLPLREAVGISLLAVIATSSAGAATYLRRGTANLRLGLTLEVVTVLGAIVGGLVAFATLATGPLEKVLLVIAITFGTINVVGGFLVTDRMLSMFKKKPEAKGTGHDE